MNAMAYVTHRAKSWDWDRYSVVIQNWWVIFVPSENILLTSLRSFVGETKTYLLIVHPS